MLTSGTKLGPYEIRSSLGAGGMGVVYRAHDTRLGRDVAIKVLTPADHGEAALARFDREMRAMAALQHPHIVAIFDVGSHEGQQAGPTPAFSRPVKLFDGVESGPLYTSFSVSRDGRFLLTETPPPSRPENHVTVGVGVRLPIDDHNGLFPSRP